MGGRKPRNRFLGDRLWDDQGREWHKRFGWLSHDDIARAVATTRVGVHRQGGPLVWLSPAEAGRWWRDVQAHTQDGERAAGSEDDDGVAYTAATWTSDAGALLVFEAHC